MTMIQARSNFSRFRFLNDTRNLTEIKKALPSELNQ